MNYGVQQMEAVPAPANEDPQWVNIADEHLDAQVLPKIITSCELVLIDGVDVPYSNSEKARLLVCWLAWSGNRIMGMAGVNIAHATYTQWPAIPIHILGREAAAPPPPPIALDAIGVRYNRSAGRWYPLKTDLSPKDITSAQGERL